MRVARDVVCRVVLAEVDDMDSVDAVYECVDESDLIFDNRFERFRVSVKHVVERGYIACWRGKRARWVGAYLAVGC